MIYSKCNSCCFLSKDENKCKHNQFLISINGNNIAPGFCRNYLDENISNNKHHVFEFEIILVYDDLIKPDNCPFKVAEYFSSYPECQKVHILDIRKLSYEQKRQTMLKLDDLRSRYKSKIFIHNILRVEENLQKNISQITNSIKSNYTIISRVDQLMKDCSFERLIKEMNCLNNRFVYWKFSNIIDQTIVFLKASIYGVYISNILKRIINSEDIIKTLKHIEESTKIDLIKQVDYINVR